MISVRLIDGDRLIEVKLTVNKGPLLGHFDKCPLNRGDRLIEVKRTVNKGTTFWEFDKCPLNRG